MIIANQYKERFNMYLPLTKEDKELIDVYTEIFYPDREQYNYDIYQDEFINNDSKELLCMIKPQLISLEGILKTNSYVGITKELRQGYRREYILTIAQLKKYVVLYQLTNLQISEYINQLFLKNEIKDYKP